MAEDNGSTGSGGNGSAIQSSTVASMRGASMAYWADPFGGGYSSTSTLLTLNPGNYGKEENTGRSSYPRQATRAIGAKRRIEVVGFGTEQRANSRSSEEPANDEGRRKI